MSQLVGKPLPGNKLTLLNSGTEYFPALIKAINAARHEIFLETYIFASDPTGLNVSAALAQAAQRGVTVRILVDGFGGHDFETTLMPQLLKDGAQVMIFRPEITRFALRRRRLRRLHRKIVTIDNHIAFVGGINIIDDLNTPHQIPPRLDFAVRIEGPLLEPITHTVRRLWETVVWANFKRRFRLRKRRATKPTKPPGQQTASLILRDNIRHRRSIENAYLSAISHARSDIYIACAYFLPGRKFLAALIGAAKRGVNVTILLQGRAEYPFLYIVTQSMYEELLSAGIRIFEYHKSFLHTKIATIDDSWATVGSSNIDPFSLLLAKEANIVVNDADFARELRQALQTAMNDGAHELSVQRWRHRSAARRLLQWMGYQVSRIAIDITGYGEKH